MAPKTVAAKRKLSEQKPQKSSNETQRRGKKEAKTSDTEAATEDANSKLDAKEVGASNDDINTFEEKLSKWEERMWQAGFPVVAGTDEAGRGPLAGPVVAAAFAILDHGDSEVRELLDRVADSKQMTAQQREELFAELTHARFTGRTAWAIAEASASEIDELNILKASLGAMARAVRSLSVLPDCVLVDGCNRPADLLASGELWTRGSKRKGDAEAAPQAKLTKWFAGASLRRVDAAAEPWRPRKVEAVIGGDAEVVSISAASILAKVHRDRLLDELHEKYPAYGFKSHKGYGTPEHMEALRIHGACEEHRRSFAPVREVLGLPTVPLLAGQQTLAFTAATTAATPASKGAKLKESTKGQASWSTPSKRKSKVDEGVDKENARGGTKGGAKTQRVSLDKPEKTGNCKKNPLINSKVAQGSRRPKKAGDC
mmetsp:Transcript_41133/g.74287  ORF Transcript_41133/g.74287 Transcript_41133/m.74287 type:complete len:429 (+) Transcript_41133:24-1310(+)